MSQTSSRVLKEISQLIFSVENSGLRKNDKLKIVKVLLSIKLKLIELLKEDLKKEARVTHLASLERSREGPERASASYGASVAKTAGQDTELLKKHDLILQFIKEHSGRVSAVKLLDLGIAGRTLRRYIKNLSDSGKVLVEKKGREHFYTVIA